MWIHTSVPPPPPPPPPPKKKNSKVKARGIKFVFTVFLGKKNNVLVVVIFPHTQKNKIYKERYYF